MRKSLKIILVGVFVLVTILMISENINSKNSTPLSLNQQNISDDTNKKNEFLLLHKTLDELSETWPESKIRPYRKAVEKFPNVDSCLLERDVNSVNWSLIKTTTELEVCLSRIHNHLGDVSKSEEWFKQQGFKVIVQSHPRGSLPGIYHSISGNWTIPTTGPLKGQKSPMSGMHIYFEEFLATTGISIGIEISPKNIVTDVKAGYTRK